MTVIPENAVDKYFVMSPENDEILFDGKEIKAGMVILIADPGMRFRAPNINASAAEIAQWERANHWCFVERVKLSNYWVDVSFVAVYADGVKIKRTLSTEWAWYVKRYSLENLLGGDVVSDS